jgi:hypothetical protein
MLAGENSFNSGDRTGQMAQPLMFMMMMMMMMKRGTSHLKENRKIRRSWWFIFCKRCRQAERGPSWEPPMWQRLCRYPFCPTYLRSARILSLVLIGLLYWGVVYAVLGQTAAPGGQLFQLAVLSILANFGGWLMSLTTLPPLIGMLLTGLLLQNVGLIHISEEWGRGVVSAFRYGRQHTC